MLATMPGRMEEIATVRQEIMDLLRQQIETLDSPASLSDERLSECYRRQDRVQALRERLQALVGSDSSATPAAGEAVGAMGTTSCAVPPPMVSDAVASM